MPHISNHIIKLLNFLIFIGLIQTAFSQKLEYSQIQIEKINKATEQIKLAVQLKDSFMLAEQYYILGKMEHDVHKFEESQRWYLKSLAIIEKTNDYFRLARLYHRFAVNEEEQLHFDEVEKYSKLELAASLKIRDEAARNQALAMAYGFLANKFINIKNPKQVINYDSAKYYFNKVEYYLKLRNDMSGLASLNINLGLMYTQKNDKSALVYFEKAFEIFTKLDKPNEITHSLLFKAKHFINYNEVEKALPVIQKAEQIYDQKLKNTFAIKRHLFETYLLYFKAKADWQNVAKYQEIVHNIEKQDLLADHKGAVSQLNIAYETEKKDSQLGKQNTVIVKQSQFIWGIGGLSLAAFGLCFVFFKLYKKNKKISHKNEVLIKEQNHRIKNNLQSISSLLNLQSNRMADSDAKSAVDESKLRVEAMANLHHKLYDGDNLAVVDLSEFVEEIAESVLQTFGYEHIKPNIDIKSIHLAADQTLSVGLIINELVTNACKYAFKDNIQPSLSIKANFENEEYVIEVTDNGKKLDNITQLNATQELQKSFGMRLVQTQVIQLQGSYCFFYKNGTQFVMRFRPILANV